MRTALKRAGILGATAALLLSVVPATAAPAVQAPANVTAAVVAAQTDDPSENGGTENAPLIATTVTVTASDITRSSAKINVAVSSSGEVPEGTVSLTRDGTLVNGNLPLTNGSTSADVTGLQSGTSYDFVATFTPAEGTGSEPSTGSMTVKTLTETTLSASRVSATPQSVSLKATVSPANAQGTITFTRGGNEIFQDTPDSSGSVSYTVGGLEPDTNYSFGVKFTPASGSGYTESATTIDASTNDTASTTTTLVAVNPTHNSAQLVAVVAPTGAPGTVQFRQAGATLGSPVPVGSDGSAVRTASGLEADTNYSFTAQFLPADPKNFHGSISEAATVKTLVEPADGTTTSITAGEPTHDTVTLTANVSPGGDIGTIQFVDVNGGNLGSPVPLSNGTASYTARNLTPETLYSFRAEFTPADPTSHNPSTSGIVSVTTKVKPADVTTTTLTAGEPTHNTVELTATIAPANAVGTVQLHLGDTDIGTPVEVVDGTASLPLAGLTPNTTYNFTVTFIPENPALFTTSTSEAVSVKTPLMATTTTLTTGATTTSTVVLDAKVTDPSGNPVTSGTVQLTIDGNNLGNPFEVNEEGAVSLRVTNLTANREYVFTAAYTPADPQRVAPSSAGPLSVVTGFTDVPTSHVFYNEITWLAGEGITTGWSDGTFRPYDPVLRDQMAAFLYRMSGSPDFTAPTTSPFRDVPTSHVFYKEITWLANEGITTGWELTNGEKEFRPYEPVLRDQMAAFLYRLAGEPAFTVPADAPFRDVPTSRVFYKEITWLAEAEVSTGWSDGTFRPLDRVLRDQMAAFLFRMDDKGLVS